MSRPVISKESKERLRTFRDAVVVVTGGASGIGKAFVEELVSREAKAIFILDRQVEVAARKVAALGSAVTVREVDVRNFNQVKAVVDEAYETYGRIDFMFNNAGIAIGVPLEQMSVEEFNDVNDVNIRGVSNGVQAVYPIMKQQGFGHIVNTSSAAGLCPVGEGFVPYGMSKYAVVGLSLNLRVEAARHGVSVSVVCPGVVKTPILNGGKFGKSAYPPELQAKFTKEFRPVDPKWFAERTLNLVGKNRKAIIIVPSQPYNFMWFIHRVSPMFGLYLSRRKSEMRARELEKWVDQNNQEDKKNEPTADDTERGP